MRISRSGLMRLAFPSRHWCQMASDQKLASHVRLTCTCSRLACIGFSVPPSNRGLMVSPTPPCSPTPGPCPPTGCTHSSDSIAWCCIPAGSRTGCCCRPIGSALASLLDCNPAQDTHCPGSVVWFCSLWALATQKSLCRMCGAPMLCAPNTIDPQA